MSEIFKKRREILFLYDVKDANPNGDPDDDNRPRMDENGFNIVTDVRLKRTIRDYWINTLRGKSGYDVLIRKEYVVDAAEIKTMADLVLKAIGIDKEELDNSKDKVYIRSVLEKIINEIPKTFIDVRCFGGAMTVKKVNYSHTGALQFSIGRSLNKPQIKSYTITTTFASQEERGAGTFGEFHGVDYSLILFHGIACEYTAQKNGTTQDDLNKLYEGLWLGTKLLNTRSKFNHNPRMLIEVVSKEKEFQIGGLDTFIRADPLEEVKNNKEIIVDITELINVLNNFKDNIEHIEVVSEGLKFKGLSGESEDLYSLLKKDTKILIKKFFSEKGEN